MSGEILLTSLALLAIVGLVVTTVLVLRQAREQTRLIEQAFIHLSSRNSAEATNAVSTLEFNRDLLKGKVEAQPPPPSPEPAVIKDKLTGRIYDILGGDV